MILSSSLDTMGLYRYRPDLFDNFVLPEGMNKEDCVDYILVESRDLELQMPDADYMRHMIGVWSRTSQYTFLALLKTTEFDYNPIENYDRHEWSYDVSDKEGVSDRTRTRNLKDSAKEERSLKDTHKEERNLTDIAAEVRNLTDTVRNTDTNSGNDTTTVTPNLTTQLDDTPGNVSTTSKTGYNSDTFKGTEQVAMSGKDTRIEKQTGNHTTDVEHGHVVESEGTTQYTGNKTVTTDYTGDKTDTIDYTGNKTNTVDYTGTENNLDKDNRNEEATHTAHLHGNIGVTTTQEMIRQEREIALFNVYKAIAQLYCERFCVMVY